MLLWFLQTGKAAAGHALTRDEKEAASSACHAVEHERAPQNAGSEERERQTDSWNETPTGKETRQGSRSQGGAVGRERPDSVPKIDGARQASARQGTE